MKKKVYDFYAEVTKEILDSIKVGDLVKPNDWKRPFRVIGVTDSYFVMIGNEFGKILYSVCEKKIKLPLTYKYNAMCGGKFHYGPDAWIFGHPGSADKGYDWSNKEWVKKYLETFEDCEVQSRISERHGCCLNNISIKHVE